MSLQNFCYGAVSVQSLFVVEEGGFFRAETYVWYIEHEKILLRKPSA